MVPWLFIGLLVLGAVLGLLLVFPRRQARVQEDAYTQGLEQWLAGDLKKAQTSFRKAIELDPGAVDPYLQLGNLLRLGGDAKRAAVLHRGLTVRNDVPPGKRVSISLALADDLIQMQHWAEAKGVLDSLEPLAAGLPRFWRARFAHCLGAGDEPAASRALQSATTRCGQPNAQMFRDQHVLFQLDRALRFCRVEKPGEAKRLLKELPRDGRHSAKVAFVRALIAAQTESAEEAVATATRGLVDAPEAMELFLPALQQALLSSGHYERSIPILETASRAETAPASLWIALALLYEKLGEREKGIALLEDKAGDPRLTPNVAAPLLKLLAMEDRHSAWARIWRTLHLPASLRHWQCQSCGSKQADVRWFCPACHSFDSFTPFPG
jgi:lipopolysaccharide biosynthesis regulator YciM